MTERRPSAREDRAAGTFMLAGEVADDPELSRLEAALAVDPRDLPRALAEQAGNYYRAGLRAARCEALASSAEAARAAAEARIIMYLRGLPHPPSGADVVARARQHADVAGAARRADAARAAAREARALVAAFEQRARMLEALRCPQPRRG